MIHELEELPFDQEQISDPIGCNGFQRVDCLVAISEHDRADTEAVERPRIAVNGVQKVAGGDVSAAMPETGPVAGGLEPLHQALDIQGIGKYHRLLPADGAAQPTADNTMMIEVFGCWQVW